MAMKTRMPTSAAAATAASATLTSPLAIANAEKSYGPLLPPACLGQALALKRATCMDSRMFLMGLGGNFGERPAMVSVFQGCHELSLGHRQTDSLPPFHLVNLTGPAGFK